MVGKNLFTFNFNQRQNSEWLTRNRALLLTLALLIITGLLSFKIGTVTQEGTKQVVRHKRTWARQKHVFVAPAGKSTVLFLGNSTISAGIIPEIFDAENHETTYSINLSLPALPLATHYFMLKDYLRHNTPPQYLILSLTPDGFSAELFPYYAAINAGFAEVLECSFFRKNADLLVNYILPWKFYWPEVKRYCLGKMITLLPLEWKASIRKKYAARGGTNETFRHSWEKLFDLRYVDIEKTARETAAGLIRDRGYYSIAEQSIVGGEMPADYNADNTGETKEPTKSPNSRNETRSQDPFIKRFFDLAQSSNISIILISDYTLHKNPKALTPPVLWKFLKNTYSNVFFSDKSYSPRTYEPKYFSDPAHANQAGAARYTKEIAQEFKEILEKTGNTSPALQTIQ